MPTIGELYRRSNLVLEKVSRTIESNIVTSEQPPLLEWKTQPDQTKPFLGAYGASGAALALTSAGRPRTDRTVVALANHLAGIQDQRGGWSIRNAANVELTTATALAMRAIAQVPDDIFPDREQALTKGAAWLATIASPDGGWPTWAGARAISLTATAHCLLSVRAIAVEGISNLEVHVNRAVTRLLSLQSPSGYWPKPDNSPAVAGTALVLLGLESAGFTLDDAPVARAVDWLMEQNPLPHCAGDQFYVVANDASASTPVIYIHFTPAVVLHAISRLSNYSTSKTYLELQCRLANHLIDTLAPGDYWTSELTPLQTPTWLMNDGCAALKEFTEALVMDAQPIALRDDISSLQTSLEIVERESNDNLLNLRSEVQQLSAEIRDMRQLTPYRLFRAMQFAARNWEFLMIAPIILICGVLMVAFSANALVIGIVGLLASGALAVAGIVSGRRDARGRPELPSRPNTTEIPQ